MPQPTLDGVNLSDAKSAADRAERSTVLRVLARGGFAASGLVHVVIGSIAISIAFGGGGDADQSGALRQLADTPFGVVVLWILVVTLTALGAWQVLETITVREASSPERWRRRAVEAGKAIVFFALAAIALVFAIGGEVNSEQSAEHWSGQLLAVPGGAILLGTIGLGILIGGGVFVWRGITLGFVDDLIVPTGAAGSTVLTVGAVGYVAKGLALGVIGALVITAVFTADPDVAGGLDGALTALLNLPFGVVLTTIVGAGLITYGVYLVARARYARI